MPTFRPSKKLIPATFAWSLLILCSVAFFGCASECLATNYSLIIPIYQGILTVFVFSNFALATFKDPGIYPRAHDDESKDYKIRVPLYQNAVLNGTTIRMKWCQTCKFYRPPRCSHCIVCDRCMEAFDHHCPWLNNCIGRRNYRYFLQFLLSLMLDMCSMLAFCLICVVSDATTLTTAQNVLLITVMIIIVLLFIPIAALMCFHLYLVSTGKTTNEQITGRLKRIDNPYSIGCFGNWMMMLYGPNWPRLTERISKFNALDLNNMRLVYQKSENVTRVYMESRNELRRNGNHFNQIFSSASLVSEKDLKFLQSVVCKQVSSDWDIRLGGSEQSIGLGMAGLTGRTFSSYSFPLVQPLPSSRHSLLDQDDAFEFYKYSDIVLKPIHSQRNPWNRKIRNIPGSAKALAGMSGM